jgi:hypothetical protein
MPFFILGLLIDVLLVIHVLKTGRNTTWIWIVVMLPMAGPIAYLIIEVLPEFSRSRTARRAMSGAKKVIDPTRDLRQAHTRLRITDSIDSRRRVADELCNAGNFAEAVDYYRLALVGLYEHDPHLLLGLARAQFELDDVTHARETLDRLIKENPEFKSSEGHLLYARALDAEGNISKACEEFETLAKYYPGAEARYRYAALLRKMGDTQRSHDVLSQLLSDAEVATKHYRKAQSQWLALAKRDLNNW